MWLTSLLCRRRTRLTPVPRGPQSSRPALEALEDRTVPSFLAPVTSGGGGVQLAVGDFNHDGRDDVAAFQGTISTQRSYFGVTYEFVTLSGKTNVSVSLSNDDGTFRRPIKLSGAPGKYLGSLQVEDRNGDGNLDVVARTVGPAYRGVNQVGGFFPVYLADVYENVWLGKGDGSFAPVSITRYPGQSFSPDFPPGSGSPQSTRADFNHDGFLDLATVDGSAGVVSVSLGKADGTSQPAQTFAAGSSPGYVATGDFNGDGWADLIVVNSLSSSNPKLSVLLNDGSW